jgi:uncharacterized protein involved in exopolysaccharide biosynthesis
MLQRASYQNESPPPDQDEGQFLSVSYFYDILKRRALYFAIPFVLILALGSIVTLAWPAQYLSEGKILISSQEIPTDLVRPTVATLSNERILYIEQRIMTRDNLVAIAKKFNLKMGWQGQITGTELTDFVRSRTKIKPVELTMQSERKQAIAFTVGFEYEQPQIALGVANELVTVILNEDVRSRSNFAAETTKFLDREVKRLEEQLSLVNTKIAERTRSRTGGPTEASDDAKDLAALRALLVIKRADYSENHPDIRAIKRRIEALEKTNGRTDINAEASTKTTAEATADAAAQKVPFSADTPTQGMDTLETQRITLRTELGNASQRLTAARMGESLERGQHSERLEVIEQPTMPKKPTSPNRPKIFALVLGFALMTGSGLVVASEALNPAIRRSTDLLKLIDGHLIVAIPNISTQGELARKKRRTLLYVIGLTVVVLLGLIAIYFVLPPLDILFDKIMAALFR